MLTLGVHDGHTATACLLEDGRVLACISEERLRRVKEWKGFPERAILACLQVAGRQPDQVDAIGICSMLPQIGHEDWARPSVPKRLFGAAVPLLPSRLLQREGNVELAQRLGARLGRARIQALKSQLDRIGLRGPKRVFEHHLLHGATAYYSNWNRPDPCLVLTLDGSGDAVAGTVQIGEAGELRRVASIFNYNSICELYTRVTQHLGLRPMSHEYKVMGMAPYASAQGRAELVAKLRTLYQIRSDRPLQILNQSGRWKWQLEELFCDLFAQERFDVVCGAVQDFFEELVLQWVRNAIRHTGIPDVALSGGGFMNVKLNRRILGLEELRSLFVFPSCGDESNPVGAAILAARSLGFPAADLAPLGGVDWGPSYTEDPIVRAVERGLPATGFRVSRHDNIDAFVGEQVAAGQIVGRLSGRMEWGARALGHRSILADPRSTQVVARLNRAIKERDFWMPFAPAILAERAADYVELSKGFRSPHMVMGCRTTARAHHELQAAIHPADRTARPQIVNRELHPRFHAVLRAFERKTGVGGVLNTSFNLHGEPIVCSPDDAIQTLLRSDLDALQLEHHYIERVRG